MYIKVMIHFKTIKANYDAEQNAIVSFPDHF